MASLAYVHGFVRNGVRTVKAGHTVLTLQDGEFEGIVPVSGTQPHAQCHYRLRKDPDRFLPDTKERQGRL